MTQNISYNDLIKIDEFIYEIPTLFRDDMRVPARFFINEKMIKMALKDKSLWQLVNVTTLPGIKKYACAMPDIHQGYGFPIGGVAATAIEEGGVISPGGIGYDINCGVRLLTVDIGAHEIQNYIDDLATRLFRSIPSGVGRGGKYVLAEDKMNSVLAGGASQMVSQGIGNEDDIRMCENEGFLNDADSECISERAKKRASDQLGTLGSGNHFIEIQSVDAIFDKEAASAFRLFKGGITVMIHCGSRGLGHQTCTDYVSLMNRVGNAYGYIPPDRELACVPFSSPEGQQYFAAMAACANFAWANRHTITHIIRTEFQKMFGESISVRTMYDVSHNMGKVEEHVIDDQMLSLVVHRKGATRSFGPDRPEVCEVYRHIGQPVLIPGTMGTASYVLAGTQKAMEVSFGSSCHGAGRKESRTQARRIIRGAALRDKLNKMGIIIRTDSVSSLAEEAPEAYKDVHGVVDVIEQAGIARRVARLRPLAVIKGG